MNIIHIGITLGATALVILGLFEIAAAIGVWLSDGEQEADW